MLFSEWLKKKSGIRLEILPPHIRGKVEEHYKRQYEISLEVEAREKKRLETIAKIIQEERKISGKIFFDAYRERTRENYSDRTIRVYLIEASGKGIIETVGENSGRQYTIREVCACR